MVEQVTGLEHETVSQGRVNRRIHDTHGKECRVVKKVSLVGAAVVACTLLAAPAASAATPAPVQGWNASISQNQCLALINGQDGWASQIPVVIGNYSDTAQTGSITIPKYLGASVQLTNSFDALAGTPACTMTQGPNQQFQQNFTVPAFGSTVLWLSFSGYDTKPEFGSDYSIGLGGEPSGQGGAGWYDMLPWFEGEPTLNLSQITTSYNGTGGTNGSNQSNFNLVACNADANAETVGLTPSILTPYSGGAANGPTYQPFQPICAAWFPQGTMVNSGLSSTPQQGMTVSAAQVNGGTVSFAGTGYTSGMTVSYQNTATSDPAMDPQAVIPLSTTPSNGPFLTVNAAGEWAAVNIPNGGVVNLIIGTTLSSPIVATYNAG